MITRPRHASVAGPRCAARIIAGGTLLFGTLARASVSPGEVVKRTLQSNVVARLAPGVGAWSAFSERQGNANIEPIDPAAVLRTVVSIPLATRYERDAAQALGVLTARVTALEAAVHALAQGTELDRGTALAVYDAFGREALVVADPLPSGEDAGISLAVKRFERPRLSA